MSAGAGAHRGGGENDGTRAYLRRLAALVEGRAVAHLATVGAATLPTRGPSWVSYPVACRLLAAGRIAKTGVWYHLPGPVPSVAYRTCTGPGCSARFLPATAGQTKCGPACVLATRRARDERRSGRIRVTVPADPPEAYPERPGVDYVRPQTRGDCAPGGGWHHRPCPYASCRHHLLLEIHAGNGHLRFPHGTDDPGALAETCSLDVAERGPRTTEETAALMGQYRQNVQETQTIAAGRLLRSVRQLRPEPAPSRPDLHWGNGEEPGPDRCL